ncbi:MAG: hypothetical protein HY455_02825 [Parcubacteria group bacterium]|nr:hypothetical protein [Parcubacteria group bacterium]
MSEIEAYDGDVFEVGVPPHEKTETIIIYLGMLSRFKKLKRVQSLPRSAIMRAAAEFRKKLPLDSQFSEEALHQMGSEVMGTALELLSHEDDIKPEEAVEAKPDPTYLIRLLDNEEAIADVLLAAVEMTQVTKIKTEKGAE